MKSVAAAALLCALLAACSPAPSPSLSPSPTVAPSPSLSSPAPSVSLPTSTPAETVVCVPETGPLPAALGDPCPSAIAAVRSVVEPLGQPITRIYLQPGPFECGYLWPGVEPAVLCVKALVLPGRTMHAWISFSATDQVAAVGLFRTISIGGAIRSPIPPWAASLAAFIVPPTGWSMP